MYKIIIYCIMQACQTQYFKQVFTGPNILNSFLCGLHTTFIDKKHYTQIFNFNNL